ncbi:hypothetical protein [Nonomuraea sediminis]|nr:hypothetical protein [Nonomuraea sediminis]
MFDVFAALVPPAVVAAAFIFGVRAVVRRERNDRDREDAATQDLTR